MSVPERFARLHQPAAWHQLMKRCTCREMGSKKARTCTACRRPPNPSARMPSTRHSSSSSPTRRNDMRCGRAPAPGTCYSRSSNIAVRAWGFCRALASPADPNWFNINGLASSTTSAYREMAGGAMRVLSAGFVLSADLSFLLIEPRRRTCNACRLLAPPLSPPERLAINGLGSP
jgi:hypothetical protein